MIRQLLIQFNACVLFIVKYNIVFYDCKCWFFATHFVGYSSFFCDRLDHELILKESKSACVWMCQPQLNYYSS